MPNTSPRHGSARILYLEDEMLIALDTAMELAEAGYADVTTCHALPAAERATAERRFDIALLDVNLQGPQTSLALGQSLMSAGTRVIFVTGDPPQIKHLVAVGFGLLEKPFTTAQLMAVLDSDASADRPLVP